MKKILSRALIFALIFTFVFAPSVLAYSVPVSLEIPNRQVIDFATLPYVRGENYIEFTIPFEDLNTQVAVAQNTTIGGNFGTFTANIPRGALGGRSHELLLGTGFIPSTARITGVDVSWQRGSDPWSGITRYTMVVHHWPNQTSAGRQAQLFTSQPTLSSQFLSTTIFNNFHPGGTWGLQLHVTRMIPGGLPDNGAVGIARNVTFRIHFR